MRWLRPWIPYDDQAGEIFCLVCTFADATDRINRRGRRPGTIVVRARSVKSRRQAMRFFKQHQRCAPHAW